MVEWERERNTYLRQHIDCKCTINIYIYAVWYPSVNHDALSYRLLSKLSGKKESNFPAERTRWFHSRPFPRKKKCVLLFLFSFYLKIEEIVKKAHRVGNDDGASNQLMFYRSALSIGGSAIIIFVSNRMSRAALEARKKFFWLWLLRSCGGWANVHARCSIQHAEWHSCPLVSRRPESLKLRKRTKKPHFHWNATIEKSKSKTK